MNNFDQSSKGINLELNIFRDCLRSKHDFEEGFIRYQDESYRKHCILIWTDFANVPVEWNFFDSEDAYKIPEGMSETDLLETLKDKIDEDAYQEIVERFFDLEESLTFDSVMENAETELDEYIEWKEEVLDPQYDEIAVRGPCQGDYVKVIVPYKTLEGTPHHPDYEGEDKKPISDMGNLFRNIIFDAPVTGKLEVSIPRHTGFETEVDLHDGLEDQYNYDKDEIVKVVANDPYIQKLPTKDKSYIIEWVSEHLPEHLDYLQ